MEWRVHISDVDTFAIDCTRLMFFRRRGDGKIEYVSRFDEDGSAIVDTADEGMIPSFAGFVVPREAVQAIADNVKPGPSKAELSRLEEALAVERVRVDQVLHRLVPS